MATSHTDLQAQVEGDLSRLASLPVSDHAQVYESIYSTLADALDPADQS